MNITESVIKEFKKLCQNEFPEKKVSARSGYGYIYVQAGLNNGTSLHYEYYQKKVQLHCESTNACGLEKYIRENKIVLPKYIKKDNWQNKRFRWIYDRKINSIDELKKVYIEMRNIFEPIILKFENNLPSDFEKSEVQDLPTDSNAYVCSVSDLLNMEIKIPNYQRPYKWSEKNIDDLLNDIRQSIKQRKIFKDDFKYRIGSVILHEEPDKPNKFNIVDGQQRLISLTLLAKYLGFQFIKDKDFDYSILTKKYTNKITQSNIFNNYQKIKEWFSFYQDTEDENIKSEFLQAFKNTLEVVVIIVHKESEAFQLFDSQNSRGKALDPHDLLKAYHLREMKDDPYEMMHSVARWESIKTESIGSLFEDFLYPILKWSQQEKNIYFTSKQIDVYKGINEDSGYTYAKRIYKSMPVFQITEPFIAGESFFNFVDHYLKLLQDIMTQFNNYEDEKISAWLNEKHRGTGFNYAKNLFYCVFLAYYDKFHNFNPMVIKKLFTWAFMIRVDMQHLGADTIRKYAIGEDAGYSNVKPMFKIIRNARLEKEIANLKINYKNDAANFGDLYADIQRINGEQNGEE